MRITLSGAMRARDVSRPTEEQLASAAEREARIARVGRSGSGGSARRADSAVAGPATDGPVAPSAVAAARTARPIPCVILTGPRPLCVDLTELRPLRVILTGRRSLRVVAEGLRSLRVVAEGLRLLRVTPKGRGGMARAAVNVGPMRWRRRRGGGVGDAGARLREGREVAGLLEVGDLGQSPGVPGLAGERGRDEDLRELDRVLGRVHPGAEAEHVRVVVLTGELGGLRRPGEGGADARHLVGGDLLAVARTADHDPEAARIADDTLGGAQHVHRIVVVRVVGGGAAVHGLVAGLAEPGDQGRLELEASVIRSQIYAHRVSLPDRRRAGLGCPGDFARSSPSRLMTIRTLRVIMMRGIWDAWVAWPSHKRGRSTSNTSRLRKGHLVTANLTRDEARTRAELITVGSYQIELDLTGGDTTFRSVSTIEFDCARPGAGTFLNLDGAARARDDPQRRPGPGQRVRRRPDHPRRPRGREHAGGRRRVRLLAQRRGPAPVRRPGRRQRLHVLRPGDVRREPGLRLLRPARHEGALRAHRARAAGVDGRVQHGGRRRGRLARRRRGPALALPADAADGDLHHARVGLPVAHRAAPSTTASRWASSAASRSPGTWTRTRSSR